MAKNRVALAFGSNLGDREGNISEALDYLREGGFEISSVSQYMESAPVDCTPDSGIFLNGACIGFWNDSPEELLDFCQKIELIMGRKEEREINSPRPIDLDILLFEDEEINSSFLKVPHPRMLERDFVMLPLDEVAPEWIIPGKDKSVREIAEDFK